MNEKPEIAIIDANGLEALGMSILLKEFAPMVEVRVFESYARLMDDTPDLFVHYFVSMQIAVEHSQFFIDRKRKTMILANGMPKTAQWYDWHIIDVCQSKQLIIKNLVQLYSGHHRAASEPSKPVQQLLSAREMEVLALVVKGLINKQIADKLSISPTTVIAHRRNIARKIGMKSVSSWTVFAIANGIVEANEI